MNVHLTETKKWQEKIRTGEMSRLIIIHERLIEFSLKKIEFKICNQTMSIYR